MRDLTQNKVLRDRVRPNWFSDGATFWYRLQTAADRHEFVLVDALVRADKDFDMLVIPGTGHGAAETPYGSRRRADFFVRHLLGVEPRWEP